MVKFVGICIALFLLAVGIVVVTQGQDLAGLFNGFRAEPPLGKAAWVVIVVVPLVLLPSAVWLCDTLLRQGKAVDALELRLNGVRQDLKEAARSQVDADAAMHHLARTDPEEAISAVQLRLTEAERVAHVQQNRNEIGNLQSRVDAIRAQQQGLQERLAPVLDKRQSIERLFLELDTGQNDIERALAEIASGDDAVALDLRLKKLTEYVGLAHGRCDHIEHASKTIASLQKDYSELDARLAPFVAANDGIARRVKDLSEARDRLAAGIDSSQRTPEGTLAERLRSFSEEKQKLADNVSQLNVQFSKLATLRKDIDELFANLNHALDIFSIAVDKDGKADVDTRVDELSTFIATTNAQFEDIESRMIVFGQLKTKLSELQSRLIPLEADEGGVISLVEQVKNTHDKLVSKIERLEEGDNGDLVGRVKTFAEAKRELEQRVSTVTEQFSKLATIRKDIAGLFEKLSSAVNGSSN
jgi:chromosome segregation ATPase